MALRVARRTGRLRAHDTKHLTPIDYKDRVGQAAGELYQLLSSGGRMPIRDLREKSGDKGMLFMAAIGWLAREDKIELMANEKGITVGLK